MDALRGTKRALFRPFPPPRRQGGFSSRAITANNPVSRPPRTQHVGEGELLWTAKASGAFNEPFEYRYAVVDGEMNVLRWDAFAHEAHFAPRDVSETNASPTDEERKRRDRVEIRDTWEFTTHPENIFRRKTFRDIVAPDDAAAVAPGTIGADALADRVERVLGAGSRSAAADDDRSAAAPVPAFRASACAAGDYVAGTTRVRLECRVLRPIPGMRLTATGSCASLGGWDRGKAAAMRFDENSQTWRVDADVSSDEFPVRYKYALRAITGAHSALESGANRVIVPLGMPEDDCENENENGGMAHQTEERHVVPGFPDKSVVAPMPRPGYGSGIVAEPPSSFAEQPGAPFGRPEFVRRAGVGNGAFVAARFRAEPLERVARARRAPLAHRRARRALPVPRAVARERDRRSRVLAAEHAKRRRGRLRRPRGARGAGRARGHERRADPARQRHHRARHVVGLLPV
jgi:hypothetical protein